MQITSRFTIAVHMLLCMDVFQEEYKVTSEFMAFSIGVNPVIIRKLLSQLKDAGLAEVRRGPGGAVPARPLDEITFLDIYRAVDCIGENTLFHFHENPSQDCPVGNKYLPDTGWQAFPGTGGHGAGTGVDHAWDGEGGAIN